MFKKINLKNIVIILSAGILLAATQLSYADYNSFTVNVPNGQGGYTAIVIQQSGDGYVGPQGEYYSQFPSVAQLQTVYGLGSSDSTVVVESSTPQVEVVTIAPPALPVYVQPDPPAPDYIWTPGYWAYNSFFEDYYWVPGTWVMAPSSGLLWTPGYWYWREGNFVFSNGYWGEHVGFYGGINYGHGYEGRGFEGGNWHNGNFVNRTVNETNVTNITNITNNTSSFNGGPGGTKVQPTPEERSFMHEKHIPITAAQKIQVQAAAKNPELRASANHGKPAIAATIKPGVFKGNGVVAARQAGAFYDKTKAVNPGVVHTINRSAPATEHAGFSAPGHATPAVQQHNKPLPNAPKLKKPVVKKPKPKIPPPSGENIQPKTP